MYMCDKFHIMFNFNQKCHIMFSKTKQNVDRHVDVILECHLNFGSQNISKTIMKCI